MGALSQNVSIDHVVLFRFNIEAADISFVANLQERKPELRESYIPDTVYEFDFGLS